VSFYNFNRASYWRQFRPGRVNGIQASALETTNLKRRTHLADQLDPHLVEATGTGQMNATPAPSAALGRPMPTRAQARAGGSKGGRRSRQNVLLIGIEGLPPALELRTAEQRFSVLEALAGAVARGKTSALAATTLVQIIKEARAEADREHDRRLAELEQKLDSLTV
jgi:hypothetical protein